MPKVYIIGASVGLPKLNLPAFEKVAEVLVQKGLEPVVPHSLFFDEDNERGGLNFEQSLVRRQEALQKCDYAVLLPGYSDDRYAAIEAVTAKNFSIQRVPYHQIKSLLPCQK